MNGTSPFVVSNSLGHLIHRIQLEKFLTFINRTKQIALIKVFALKLLSSITAINHNRLSCNTFRFIAG